jgi:hypothetical protein
MSASLARQRSALHCHVIFELLSVCNVSRCASGATRRLRATSRVGFSGQELDSCITGQDAWQLP